MSTVLQNFSNDLAAVGEQVLRSLVQVRNGKRGAGAGTIWHADGLIITNAHVVDGIRQGRTGDGALTVLLSDGRELPAYVLARDPEHDLAALRVDAQNLPTITLGDSRQLQAGQFVLCLGFPWGVTGGATSGIVIDAGAALPEVRDPHHEWIAASLHLRPGHSGGPMVDVQGRLVGINTMMNGPDVGVAVPVHVAKAFLKQAMAQMYTRV
ncbi:MAG: trypsin-like peptidase domain-containing protein [Chloroflexi bacterium]|nr:trypsin-like peptidase domain-containing protein [Chloroflexota bacterium]